jgi:very-short-patch-repair endonuclease
MGWKHTKETKDKISKSRKKWLSENKDKHPWKRSDKFTSVPCEHLKKILSDNGISFLSEIQPLTNRYFSIDIALVDRGIGIEVNGNQHYNRDKTLKKYYRDRKYLIENAGWEIIEIHYTKVFDSNFISDLIKYIDGIDCNINLDFEMRIRKESTCIDCGEENSRYSKRCITCHNVSRRTDNYYNKKKKRKRKVKEKSYCNCGNEKTNSSEMCFVCYGLSQRKVERPTKETLIREVNNLGYCAVGRKYGVSDNAIRKWIK